MGNELIDVDVVYALPHEQIVVSVKVPVGSTASQALKLAGLAERYPELEAHAVMMGIYGRRIDATTVLKPGDRVEIYRPLVADPKLARLRRVRQR